MTLNSSTLWNTRLSFDRFEEPHDKVYGNIDPQLPFQGPFQLTGPPFVQVSGVASETMFPRTAYRRDNNALSLNSSISKTMGRHFTKMGGEIRAYDFYRNDEFTTNGTFGFNSTFTRRDPLSATGATSGSAMASFLLGLPNSGSVQTGIPRTEQYRYYALFVQDDWKLGARATLNVGLRWDYQPPVTVKDNLTVSDFDDDVGQPAAGAVAARRDQPGNRTAAAAQRRAGVRQPWRPGLAVRERLEQHPAARRLLVQGERVADRPEQLRALLSRAVERRTERRVLHGFFEDHAVPRDGARQHLAGHPVVHAVSRRASWSRAPASWGCRPTSARASPCRIVTTKSHTPTSGWRAWTSSCRGTSASTSRTSATRSASSGPSRPINEVPKSENDKRIPSLGGTANYLNVTFPNPFAGLAPGQTLNAATVARGDLLRPYPQFTGITRDRLNLGSAYYNALEAAATKRYTNGVMFAVNYTLMKLEDQINFFTNYDTEPFRDLQGDQRRNRLVITTLVDLPFGPGKPIGGSTTGLVAHLIGGWQFNTIGEIQSGRPLALNASSVRLVDSVALPKSEQSFERWFDNSSTALNNPRPDGTFAWTLLGTNEYRVAKSRFHDVNEPSEPQWSFSFFKNTRLGSRVNMQVRVETFNVFNVRVYGGPNTDPNSANFGIVSTASQVNFPRTTQVGVRFTF